MGILLDYLRWAWCRATHRRWHDEFRYTDGHPPTPMCWKCPHTWWNGGERETDRSKVIRLRLPAADLDLLRRAAAAERTSVTALILDGAEAEARRVLARREHIVLVK